MRIPDRILNIVEKQLDADCGIGADRGNTVTTENKTVICRAPPFPGEEISDGRCLRGAAPGADGKGKRERAQGL